MGNGEYEHQARSLTEKKKTIRKRRWLIFLVLIFLASGAFWLYMKMASTKEDETRERAVVSEESGEDKEERIRSEKEKSTMYIIKEGDIPADIFLSEGNLDANDVEALLLSAKNVYDFSNLKIGQTLRFYFQDGEKASRIEYDKNTEKIIVARRQEKNFLVEENLIQYDVLQEIGRGKIDDFFYADALEAGLTEATILEMADLFSFSIDFTTEIQQGDEFAIVFEKRSKDGERASDGRILAAKFVNEGKAHFAYYFDNQGKGGFYDDEGRVLERQFLKAPLSYRRISSGYTGARMHPITKRISAHYQIDYAAPVGTPVVASARGSVASAGWEGGWGNMIRLKHDGGYTTHYGHLSAFAKGIKSGASVAQGQVIGYVGSTGWSTGPHLDYGMRLNGSPVNPLALNLPKGNPLDENSMRIFEEEKKKYADKLR